MIAGAALTHDVLARAQALAWVFDDAVTQERVADRELASLGPGEVASSDALAIATSSGPVAEVLRAAAELELPELSGLTHEPAHEETLEAIAHALEGVKPAAPSLDTFEIAVARPLGLRGRTLGSSILVGCPGIGCPEPEHVAWQAAHEATVSELSRKRLPFLELEKQAIARLRSRARAAGLDGAHARWLSRLDLRALGSIPDVEDAAD